MINHWKIILSLALIFLAGVFVGHELASRKPSEPNRHHDRRIGFQEKVMGDLMEKLSLTEEQIEKIEPIVTEMELELKEVRDETFNLTKEVIDRMNAKIANELTPDQQSLFEQWHEEQRRRWKDRSSGKKEDKAGLLNHQIECTKGRC